LGKPKEKRPPGRPRRRWEDSKMDLKQTGWAGIVWINPALNIGKEFSGSTKCGKIID